MQALAAHESSNSKNEFMQPTQDQHGTKRSTRGVYLHHSRPVNVYQPRDRCHVVDGATIGPVVSALPTCSHCRGWQPQNLLANSGWGQTAGTADQKLELSHTEIEMKREWHSAGNHSML